MSGLVVTVKHRPVLDPGFLPAALWERAYAARVERQPGSTAVILCVTRPDGTVFREETRILPHEGEHVALNLRHVERMVKLLLWMKGGSEVLIAGPPGLVDQLATIYAPAGPRGFDCDLVGNRIFRSPLVIRRIEPGQAPARRMTAMPLGRHLDGCRIGFDLGASDYKVAAVIDGRPVWSEEIPWAPSEQPDPEYHYERIQAGLKKAAAHLPRVDAIGGSSAGIIIRRQVRIASLFRSVPPADFETKVKGLFDRLAAAWAVPFEVLNDGEVTALAGRLSLDDTGVLGVAMGSSEAAGFLDDEGHIPGWLDELAFAPVDLNPEAAADEWSRDRGVGANYLSQQAVARLAQAAGLSFPDGLKLPERLEQVQALVARGNMPAARIFEQIGEYLGWTIPWYEVFYRFRNFLVLGRVMSGPGGKIIVDKANEVLAAEFPRTAARVRIHLLDEKSRRVGQAVAAASLPEIQGVRP
jgi:predicted NBD/HSP70 family sugar kinase